MERRIKGIYFLMNRKKEVIYIGKSTNILSRVKVHKSKKHIKFHSYNYIEFDFPEKDLCLLERLFIVKFKPKLNKQCNPDWQSEMKIYWKQREKYNLERMSEWNAYCNWKNHGNKIMEVINGRGNI